MAKILICTEAWTPDGVPLPKGVEPQINGVFTTFRNTVEELTRQGHTVKIISPDPSRRATKIWLGKYGVLLEFRAQARVRREISEFQPDFIHIATEGPLGWAVRNVCLQEGRPFTTSYHTQWPEYLWKRYYIPSFLTYIALRRFHRSCGHIMVPTPSVQAKLERKHFKNVVCWSRGVHQELFHPHAGENLEDVYKGLPRPILLYFGRVDHEKNLPAFLDLDVPGTKVVIGGGGAFDKLQRKYGNRVKFLGPRIGTELARHVAAADLFVFPSKTDTFGLVLIEAAASGLPIAAYPVEGPVDVLDRSAREFAVLHDDLKQAVLKALALPREKARAAAQEFAKKYTWKRATEEFFRYLEPPTPENIERTKRAYQEELADPMALLPDLTA